MHLIATAHRRIRIVKEKKKEKVEHIIEVEVENVPEPKLDESLRTRALQQEIISTLRDLISSNPLFK